MPPAVAGYYAVLAVLLLETRIQRLHDVFVEKGHGVHEQRMFKMSRAYTLTEILSKIFVKKRRKI